jgi:MFS superfamily sulfate permease-like transporter
MPIFELVPYCIPHALAICCVTVALHFSMTKLFANKFNYSIDLSHELYAIGFGTTASGFFPTYPTSTALARTVVLVESGAKTQLASGLSSLLVLVVILFVGPLFQSLPQVYLIYADLNKLFSAFYRLSLWCH